MVSDAAMMTAETYAKRGCQTMSCRLSPGKGRCPGTRRRRENSADWGPVRGTDPENRRGGVNVIVGESSTSYETVRGRGAGSSAAASGNFGAPRPGGAGTDAGRGVKVDENYLEQLGRARAAAERIEAAGRAALGERGEVRTEIFALGDGKFDVVVHLNLKDK